MTGAGGSNRGHRVEVFFDGACPVCRASRAWAERRDRGHRLDWLDATDPGCANRLPTSAAELAQAVWIRRGDGSLASGYRAWLAVLDALPGWSLPARLLALAPLSWLGSAIYRLVAGHRHRLSGG